MSKAIEVRDINTKQNKIWPNGLQSEEANNNILHIKKKKIYHNLLILFLENLLKQNKKK